MNYIINPAWFYWLHVIDTLRLVVALCFGVTLVGSFILLGAWLGDWACDDDISLRCKKWAIRVALISVACVVMLVLVPNKTTMIEILIAKTATKENAELTVDALKGAVDYIVQAMGSLK